MLALIVRVLMVIFGAMFVLPFAVLGRKKLNEAKARLNEHGLSATPKNLFFLEASIAEAKRKERDRLLIECGDQINGELAEARAARRVKPSTEKVGS